MRRMDTPCKDRKVNSQKDRRGTFHKDRKQFVHGTSYINMSVCLFVCV